MRFSTAAVVTGLAAVAAADNSWGAQGGWGGQAGWGPSSSAVAPSSAVASSSAIASSSASAVWTTDVVTAFTTYCPEATAITHKGSTYSVTEATTLTITNCPGGCTITRPVYSSVVTVCHSCSTPSAISTPIVVPSKPASSAVLVSSAKPSVGTSVPWKPSANSTATATWTTGAWSSSSAASTPSASIVPYKGAASKTTFGVAGLIAAVGLVAAL